MHTSLSCAWTGALYQAGGLGAAVWIALRTLWLHIRVCWDRSPGQYFFYISVILGILLPAAFLTAATLISGYSFRLGGTCIINHENSFAVFWGWLLGLAAFAFLMQWITTAYCFGIYLNHMRAEQRRNMNGSSDQNGGTPAATDVNTSSSETGILKPSTYAHRSRMKAKKLRRLIFMQWRGFAISILVVFESVFYVTVFWSQDKRFEEVTAHPEDQSDVESWSLCLVTSRGDKTKCLPLVSKFVVSPTIVLASFVMASVSRQHLHSRKLPVRR